MKTKETTLPMRSMGSYLTAEQRADYLSQFQHYDLPTPLTEESVCHLLQDEPEVVYYLLSHDKYNMRNLLEHADIFDIIIHVAKQTINSLREKDVKAILEACSPEFLESLPATVQGFSQQETGYWIEPTQKRLRADSPVWRWQVTADDTRMCPRFMPGSCIEMEEVHEGDPLNVGEVYFRCWKTNDQINMHGWGRLASMHGNLMRLDDDSDPAPEGMPESYKNDGIPTTFSENFHLFRFISYQYGRPGEVIPQSNPVHKEDWEDMKDCYIQEEKHQKRLARRRELYAQKKAKSEGLQSIKTSLTHRSSMVEAQGSLDKIAA